MALGDSISAGFAMNSGPFWDVLDLVEYRGEVFSIGGDVGAYTVPNFLKTYNPNLVGYSEGWSLPLDAIAWENGLIQAWDPNITHLNGAQSQAKIVAAYSQVDYITNQILTTYNGIIDIETDWKMMTIFMGINNLCGACVGRNYSYPDYYEESLNKILTKVHKQLPRTFVNLIPFFNVSQVYPFAMSSDYCTFMWNTICHTECICMTDYTDLKDRKMMDIYGREYNARMYKVAAEWEAMNFTDFTVVVQPFIENMIIYPQVGLEALSELDCFHPSVLADTEWAISMWNNLMTPPAEKLTTIPKHQKFICPTEDTYIQ